MRRFLLSIAVVVQTSAFAQETQSQYEYYGFSDDAKFMAFQVYYQEGIEEDPAESKVIIVDVAKNNWATKPFVTAGASGEDVEAVHAKGKKAATPLLAKYKITPGKNRGTEIPLKKSDEEEFHTLYPEDTQVFTIDGVKYTMELHSFQVDPAEDDLGMNVTKKMFELVVKYNGKTQILQKDTKLPASRGFATGYSILQAWHIGTSLAVMLEYRAPGFEGVPDKYQMVVTGVLGK